MSHFQSYGNGTSIWTDSLSFELHRRKQWHHAARMYDLAAVKYVRHFMLEHKSHNSIQMVKRNEDGTTSCFTPEERKVYNCWRKMVCNTCDSVIKLQSDLLDHYNAGHPKQEIALSPGFGFYQQFGFLLYSLLWRSAYAFISIIRIGTMPIEDARIEIIPILYCSSNSSGHLIRSSSIHAFVWNSATIKLKSIKSRRTLPFIGLLSILK